MGTFIGIGIGSMFPQRVYVEANVCTESHCYVELYLVEPGTGNELTYRVVNKLTGEHWVCAKPLKSGLSNADELVNGSQIMHTLVSPYILKCREVSTALPKAWK